MISCNWSIPDVTRMFTSNNIYGMCRKILTDEEIQAMLFDYPSCSEDNHLEDSGSDDEYSQPLRVSSSESECSTESSKDVEVTATQKKVKKTWHWVKKDIDVNLGEELSVIRSGNVKTPLGLFLQLVDHDLLEFLTFETNRYRIQQNRTNVLPVSLVEMRKFINIVLYVRCKPSFQKNILVGKHAPRRCSKLHDQEQI